MHRHSGLLFLKLVRVKLKIGRISKVSKQFIQNKVYLLIKCTFVMECVATSCLVRDNFVKRIWRITFLSPSYQKINL